MSGKLLLLGCIYIQSQFILKWLDTLPLLEEGVLTHQLFDESGRCKNYLFRAPSAGVGKSENYHRFPDAQFSISVSTNNAFGLINKFATSVTPLPFQYNALIIRPLKQCSFSTYLKLSKQKSYYRKSGSIKDPLHKRVKLDNKYFHYLISICPYNRPSITTSAVNSTRGNITNNSGGLLASLYPYRLDYLDPGREGLNKSELYFNIAITSSSPIKLVLALGVRLGCAIIASAILYKFV